MSKQTDKSVYYIPKGSPLAPVPFDVRVVDRQITSGDVKTADYDKYLGGLEDSETFAETLSYDEVVGNEDAHKDSDDGSAEDDVDLSF